MTVLGEGGLPQFGPLPLVGVPAGEPGVRALAAQQPFDRLPGDSSAGVYTTRATKVDSYPSRLIAIL